MDFGTIFTSPCVNVPPPPNVQCSDPAFALKNPALCPVQPSLLLVPGDALVCLLGSIQFRVFSVVNGVQTDVTDQCVFSVSDSSIAVIGAGSGNATGIQDGDVTVTASFNGLTATAVLTVIGTAGSNCCDQETVAYLLMIDTSLSMSQIFGGQYATKLDYAKAAAITFIQGIDTHKDTVGVMSFDAVNDDVIVAPTANAAQVETAVGTISQTQNSTAFYTALQTAIQTLAATNADRQVIVLISDGQDETTSYNTNNPIALTTAFKHGNGFVICLGVRAVAGGFSLLSAFSTGGFFVNAYPGVEGAATDLMNGLKGYVCGGNCVPVGDKFVPTGQLNYTGWANWTGQADLLGSGFIDLLPGNGLYVDLSSAAAPFDATLVSKNTFNVAAGKNYSLTLFLAGNQRVDIPSSAVITVASASVTYINQTISISDYTQGFTQASFSFTPQADDVVTITITGSGSTNLAIAGPLLDKVSFDNTTDGINILFDNFDTENEQYVPPRCGTGTTPYYNGTGFEYLVGTDCYSDGCLNATPPPAQLQDPNPLPDIEAGTVPPQTFSSTKQACVGCPSGFVNVSDHDLVPAMTDNTTPSGVASVSSGFNGAPAFLVFDDVDASYWASGLAAPFPHFVQYQFSSPVVVTEYAVTVPTITGTNPPPYNITIPPISALAPNGSINECSPTDWQFQGSNDGSTWTTLDTQSGLFWGSGQRQLFGITNTTAYTYYRLLITGNSYAQANASQIALQEIELFGATTEQVCSKASATSVISQADADSKAIALATTQAQLLLNCQQEFTSTQSYTAHCPAGSLGSPVTKTATATSFVSQAAADAAALAAATAAANAALTCDGDNTNQAITINDNAVASPYPSVEFIASGAPASITKATVTVKNFSHQAPSDVVMVLRSPTGTYVTLMALCGGPLGASPVTNLTFTFDDAAASSMPQNSVLTSGTWKPTQFPPYPSLSPPASVGPYQNTLAAFNGENGNGAWSLWILDIFPVHTGSIAGLPVFAVTLT